MSLPAESSKPSERKSPKRSTAQQGTVTVKLPKATLAKIEETIAAVQKMAEGRQPEKAQVLAWMLLSVKPEDLRAKMEQWNALFAR